MKGPTNSQVCGTPTVFSAFRLDWGDHIQIVGYIQYRRIEPKKGVLSGSIRVYSNSDSGNYYLTTLYGIGSKFGISFKTPSSNTSSGWYIPITPQSSVDKDLLGLGAPLQITNDGKIALGRYYTEAGGYGGWSLVRFSDYNIVFGDVVLEEV